MEVLVIQGSPKKKGNTATMANQFIEGLKSKKDVEISEYWLNDLDIHPCQGCFQCSKTNRCIIEDDMREIYPKIESSQLLVFAVPIYWWHMNAQTKLFIDRLTALLSPDDKLPVLANKQIILCISYNFRSCAECTIKMFEDFREWINIKLSILEHCAKEGHVNQDPSKLQSAFELGQTIGMK